MQNLYEYTFQRQAPDFESFLPVFYRLNLKNDKNAFLDLQEKQLSLFVFDEINFQIEALIKSQNPSIKLSAQQMTEAFSNYVKGRPLEEIGVWVYYQWSSRLVHLLDETEFVHLRTNRNKYKITEREQKILAQKKVGVIGLSVGQAAALTLTMERGFGEIRLADFDTLDMTNLNRLRTGIHNLGISKVILAAREIAEIDPFLKVTCFTEGLTEQNMDAFFLEGGKLDMVVEECDGLDIKILCRYKAKALGIPVVMEASDRGTIDIERFDLQPDREILHGFVKGLAIDNLKTLSNEEKIPYLLPMVGINTMSTRLKASLFEVEQTINTWPQLGSAVALGGALVADVCRRIFLNEFTASGRYHVDIEEMVGQARTPTSSGIPPEGDEMLLDFKFMVERIKINAMGGDYGQIDLTEKVKILLIEAATKAPSGGNSQPWRWCYHDKTIFLFCHRKQKSLSFLDFNGSASFMALGAAAENLILKAHSLGMEVSFDKKVLNEADSFIGAFRFYAPESAKIVVVEPHICDSLAQFIDVRHTNRSVRPRKKLAASILERLSKSVDSIKDIHVTFLEDESRMEALSTIIGKIDKLRLFHEKGHAEFMDELRWTAKEAQETRDGVYLGTLDLTPSEKAGLELAKDWNAIQYLHKLNGGSSLERTSRKSVNSASAIGLISATAGGLNDFFTGGRALQRVWLTACENKIALQPLTAATFLFLRLKDDKNNELSPSMALEMGALKNDLQEIFPELMNRTELFIFRIFEADEAAERSQRYPIEKVFLS